MENLSISKYIFESPRLGFRTSDPKVLLNGMN